MWLSFTDTKQLCVHADFVPVRMILSLIMSSCVMIGKKKTTTPIKTARAQVTGGCVSATSLLAAVPESCWHQ